MIADYLAPWDLIMERLRDQVPELQAVLSAPDLAAIREDQQRTPNAQVMYDGDDVASGDGASAGRGAAQVVYQRYLVYLCVRNVRDPGRLAGAFGEAGPLVSKIIKALAGWQPSSDFRPLRRTSAGKPLYSPGYVYFPVGFSTQLITTP